MASSSNLYPHGLTSLTKEQGLESTMEQNLKRLGKITVKDMPGPSAFVKPYTIAYEMDGKERRWDAVESHASVGVLIYHKERDAAVLVRQFRPAIWAWNSKQAEASGQPPPPLSAGFTYELCAGLADKAKPLKEIAAEEISEETGFHVAASDLSTVASYNSSVGTSGSLHHIFTCDVDDSMLKGTGGGLVDDGEAIEVLLLPLNRIMEFAADDSLPKSSAMLLALMYLLTKKRQS